MGQQAKFSIEKRVKVGDHWKFCKPAIAGNNRMKPNVVMVNGVEEVHAEGYYVLHLGTRRIRAGTTLAEALTAQKANIGGSNGCRGYRPADRGACNTGQEHPRIRGRLPGRTGLKVLCKERRDKTYAATRLALTEFADHTDAKYLRQIKADVSYIRQHIAWTIKSSPTHSGRTACNKYLTLLCWLAWADAVPMVGNGAKAANVHEGRTALC